MSMTEWAKNEIAIACKKENPDWDGESFDYGCSCYASALKAYLSLMDDEHSGFSFSITKNILMRLLESKPLTPIDDIPEVWADGICGWPIERGEDGSMTYQCKRMYSLFKTVHPDGRVEYYDTDRYYCTDEVCNGSIYTGGGAGELLGEYFPITMPYYPPNGKYVIHTGNYLTNRKNGDWDTTVYRKIVTPEGNTLPVHRYFGQVGNEWKEITLGEFMERKRAHYKRIEKENSNIT